MIAAFVVVTVVLLAALVFGRQPAEGGFVTTHRNVYLAYRCDGSLVGQYGTEEEAVLALGRRS